MWALQGLASGQGSARRGTMQDWASPSQELFSAFVH